MKKTDEKMTKFDEIAQQAMDEYDRGEFVELTEDDFDLSPEDLAECKKEAERRLKEYEIKKEQNLSKNP